MNQVNALEISLNSGELGLVGSKQHHISVVLQNGKKPDASDMKAERNSLFQDVCEIEM